MLVLNLLGVSLVTGYIATEFVYPYVKRKWFARYALHSRLGLPASISLTRYEEELVASSLILPPTTNQIQDSEKVFFRKVGGHAAIIDKIERNVLMQKDGVRRKGLAAKAPSGILFYGPPGCGKTLLAGSLAMRTQTRFLNINLATILDRWVV